MKTIERLKIVEEIIAEGSGTTIERIYSKSREAPENTARQVIWTIAYDYLGMTYKAIGRVYSKDHTTIISGCRRIRETYKADLKQLVNNIEKIYPGLIKRLKKDELSISLKLGINRGKMTNNSRGLKN